MPSRIEDYALIGDLGTAALVARDGSIDWLCWPRFDSDACFAALLARPSTAAGRSRPSTAPPRITRRYRPNTLILETRFETAEGAATLIDFMPPRDDVSHLDAHRAASAAASRSAASWSCASATAPMCPG